MFLVGTVLSGFSVVPGNNSTKPLLPFNLAFVGRREVRAKNRVSDVLSLMRAMVIIICQPFPIDIVEMIKAEADEVIQSLFLKHADTALDVSVGLWNPHWSLGYFGSRVFPELIKPDREFRVPVANQMARLNTQILKPHGGISRLLKHPFLGWMKRGRTHENAAASNVDEHEHISVDPSSPCEDRFAEKIARNQGLHVRTDKVLPRTGRLSPSLVWNGVNVFAFQDVKNGCESYSDSQFLQFTMKPFISPSKVFQRKPKHQVNLALAVPGRPGRLGLASLGFRQLR